jgi:uncharacterized membrane protein
MSTISALSSLAGIDFRRRRKPQAGPEPTLAQQPALAKRRLGVIFRPGKFRPGLSAFLYPRRYRKILYRRLLYPYVVYPCLGFATMASLTATPATADFRVCNFTKSRVGIAIGYNDHEGKDWVTEGWWNIAAGGCESLLRGNLTARFYYIYAIDYDRGGEWSGSALMCTRDKEFTIKGTGDCLTRGYDRTGFSEVDTGGQQNWTVQLTEAGETPQPGGPGRAFGPLPGGRTFPSPPPAGSSPR